MLDPVVEEPRMRNKIAVKRTYSFAVLKSM